MIDILLTAAELVTLTGYRSPAAQLRELHRQGYTRACRPRLGPVVLPRAHYEAVNAANPAAQAREAQNAQRGPNVVGLQQWAKGRKPAHGQKAQGR